MMNSREKTEKKPGRKTGFTLIELLIVISILVIMISIMAVAAGPIMRQVYVSSCSAQLKTLAQVYLNYTNQYSITFPPLQSPGECTTQAGSLPAYSYNGQEGSSPYDNLIYNGPAVGYGAGFGPLAWQQLVAASYYVCPAITDRDQWWHDGPGGDDYWNLPSNSNPDTCLQVNIATGGAPTVGNQIIASYSIRPKLYRWTPAQVTMPRGGSASNPVYPAYRAFIADSFYVDQTQLSVTNRHRDGVNVAYLDGTVRFLNYPYLTQTPAQNPDAVPTSHAGSTLDNMWADFDLN